MKAEKITPQRHDPQGYTPQTEPVIMQMAKEVMEKVNPKDRVRVENGLHYIDGVPALRWGQWQDCTYAGPVAIICNLLGIPVSYEDIMGLCGACYRIAMEEHWDPSASMLQVGPNCETIRRQHWELTFIAWPMSRRGIKMS